MKRPRIYIDASVVDLDKIRGFNAVNLREGYSPIEIRIPREVV